ncbi:DDE-type integrase/transposase/recombinase [Ottowia beijingensis]|uniref:DDE-type integrase/transposase/recombinase n=1 Tax=Ottowia beijingensis TaxID=1207057 RepID=A0A853IU64_9BURK|nr:DDE-type integrase/transposase/recombinase [Ottowia beijingensis]NZA00847.1 DDE-type integrase/transposase/recombinase [Ottowia beijingensis]
MRKRVPAPVAEVIVNTGQSVASAARGERGALVAAAAQATGRSRATVYRHMRAMSVQPARRQRADAGTTSVTREEALAISELLMAAMRKNNKRLMTVADALQVLRYDGSVRCERVDPATGEVSPLSAAAVERALRLYGVHPRQLLRPAPTTEMQSLHPNHVWQIDASLCVLYYLSNGQAVGDGLQVLDADKFYKNKPKALERVEAERVWRYVVTDHYSGALFVHYVMGAESALNLAESFIAAICQRTVGGQADPFHGVPLMVYMDRGAANTSGMARNLFRRLQVRQEAHMPGAPWATGQVEKAQDIVERKFEAALRFQPVHSLAQLNDSARCWARHFNASAEHSRHGRTRTDLWLTIAPEQLRVAPAPELCRELLTHEPVARRITQTLTVEFKGREYDLRPALQQLGDVMVGEKLLVTYNPYATASACIVEVAEDGSERLIAIPQVERNDAGLRTDAPVFGLGFAAMPQTAADRHRSEIARRTYDAATDEEAERARKAKALPFGGRIDPLRQAREAVLPTPIPKRGTPLQPTVQAPAAAAEPRLLTHFEATRELTALGVAMNPERVSQLRAWHPEGVPEDQLATLQHRLTVRAGLRVVGGVAANE